MKKLLRIKNWPLFILMVMCFTSVGWTQTTDLIISEYGEGSTGNAKYIEIYNGTGATVALSGYRIQTGVNGAALSATITFTAGTNLANGATWVVANNTTDVPGANQTSGTASWNGDDAIALQKNISSTWTNLDVFGVIGTDPGTGWSVAGTANATVDRRISRKATVCSPVTTWVPGTNTTDSEWVVGAAYSSGAATAGHTSSCSGATTATTPTISATGTSGGTDTYINTATITLVSSGSNHIYYTLDGTTPTASSTEYTAPFVISSSATIKALATATGLSNSDVATKAYIIVYPPSNDLCSGAVTLVPGTPSNGTVVNATASSGLAQDATSKDVWYVFTPSVTGAHTLTLTVTGAASDFDIRGYTTTCPSSGSSIAGISAANTGNSSETLSNVTLSAGTTYYFRVLDYDGTGTTFTMNLTAPVPTITNGTPTAMTAIYGGTATTQNVTVGGSNLTDNITATLSNTADFSISPSSFTTAGGTLVITYHPTGIGSHTGTVTLSSAGASDKILNLSGTASIGTPTATAATSVTNSGFTANWNAIPGATSYQLDVYSSTSGTVNSEITKSMDSYGFTNTQTFPSGVVVAGKLNFTTEQNESGTAPAYYDTGAGVRLYGNVANGNGNTFTLNISGGVTVTGIDVTRGTGTQAATYSYFLDNSTTAAGSGSFVASAGVTALTGFSATSKIVIKNTSTGAGSAVRISAIKVYYTETAVTNTPVSGSPFTISAPAVSQTLSGLAEHTTYKYVVRAVSASNTSANSNEVSVTTLATPATFGAIAQTSTPCPNDTATFQVTGLLAGSTNTLTYHVGAGADETTSLTANLSGVATFGRVLSSADNGAVLTVTAIQRTDAASASVPVTANNTVTLSVSSVGTYYADTDNDTYGNPAVSQQFCGTPPAGWVTDNTDCNDNDNTQWQSGTFYVDADGDGYDNGSALICYGATVPAGYSQTTLGSDCNDNDAAAHSLFTFYVDGDFDGYGSSATGQACAVNAMTPPSGFSTNNTDCNDSVAAINPGHAEVAYNGVDDNCDGQLDEGMQLTTQVIAAQCGATLAAINSVIQVNGVTNATKYRYRVYKLVGGVPSGAAQIVERAQPYFTLTNLASYEYATTYRIDVEVQRNNIWLGYYGTTCDVSTPAILDTGGAGTVNPSQCGSQLATISSLIYTTSLNGVTGYRFKVTNLTDPTAPNQVQTIDRTTQWFSLPMLASYNYGTTYLIEVAVKTTGTYGGYGAGCEISTPAVPMLVTCDQHLSQPTSYVYTSSMNKATSYRFEVSLVDENDLPVSTQSVDRNIHYFNFAMVPGYVPGGKYQVRVAIRTAGWYSPYGEACYVYAPVSARNDGSAKPETLASVFEATVFPNPYSESFLLNLESTSQEKVEIRVYDMVGKLLDDRTFEHNQVELETFGARYPSGVYNIVLTQGGDVKTLRVIKR